MAQKRYLRARITSRTTTTVIPGNCFVTQILASCSVAGTATLKVQDQTPTNPFILVAPYTLAVPADGKPISLLPLDCEPVFMQGGCDVVTAGAADPTVQVWIHAQGSDSG